MERAVPPADDLLDELAFLRKGPGLSIDRLERADVVTALLRGSPSDSDQRIMSRFVSAIHALEEADADLLRAVYGLNDSAEPILLDRRRAFADRINRGIDTVANREKAALTRLARVLTRGSYAQSPLVIDVPEMHSGLVYESTSTMIVVENRLWTETHERYRFVAEFDEMDYLTVTRSYEALASTPAAGQFRVNSSPTSHGFDDHFWHVGQAGRDTPMRRGHPYDLRFRLSPATQEEPLVNAYRAFHQRSLMASIQVQFLGPKPEVSWKYERVSHFAQPGSPTAANQMTVDDAGILSLRLRDVHGGLVSGLAWRW